MAQFEVGDIVVLSSGSMRMAVESVNDTSISTVWCNEGIIGRDTFPAVLIRKWEQRDDSRGAPGGDRGRGGDRPRTGDRDGKPQGKPGWDGKPREKKFFRKD